MQAFVPKNRRPKFELHLKIIELNNVPLVSGTAYVKWHLPHSSSAQHRGRTSKSIIKDHKVQWNYEKQIPLRLIVDKNSMLQESDIHFEVLQEYSSGARGERITLGNVKLNLAEYVEAGDGDVDEGITRRYLMQDSKINSTLKILITMKQIEGDKSFFAPPLKSAPVFGGIAGIMSNEQTEQDELGHLNNMNFKATENRELQDTYRRTLAASFAAQAGELPADECIESIFAGGDGWRDKHEENSIPADERNERQHGRKSSGVFTRDVDGDGDSSQRYYGHHKTSSSISSAGGDSRRRKNGRVESHDDHNGHGEHLRGGGGDGDGGPHRHGAIGNGNGTPQSRPNASGLGEVDEFDVREDIRSWRLPYSG